MASNPFDRVIFNVREKPLSADWNRVETQADYSLRMMLREMYSRRASFSSSAASHPAGFVANGMQVVPQASPNMTVTVKAGCGFMDVPADIPASINGIISLDDPSTYKPLVLLADTVFAVPAAPGANSRIDIIEVRPNRLVTDPQSRLILNTGTGAFDPATVNKTLAYSLDGSVGFVTSPALSTTAIGYKTGVVAASPVEPTVTPGYVKIARINVGTSVTTITGASLVDRRPLLFPGGTAHVTARWRWQFNGGPPSTVITLEDLCAPPGIQVGLFQTNTGTPTRGSGTIVITGGEITSGNIQATVESDNVGPVGLGFASVTLSSFTGASFCLPTTPTGLLGPTSLGTFTPAIAAGATSKAVAASIFTTFQEGGVTYDPSTGSLAVLDDIVLSISAHLTW
jgi:hypothetical protein